MGNKFLRVIGIIIFQFVNSSAFGQTTISNYGSIENFNLNPKSSIRFENNVVTPISFLKNDTSDIGLLFTDNQAKLIKAFRFRGNDRYVINQIIPGNDHSILVAAEGYSKNNQESFYFIEFKNDKIINSFVFNEGGNELDPFSIIENVDKTITITGFVKKREFIGSFDFNMFNEDQFMYIAKFNKSGSKIWSKGIQFPNYTEPSATKIINAKNHNYILAYGKKIIS